MDVHVDSLMSIALEGPKLKATKTNVVIRQVWAEFCSRHERHERQKSKLGKCSVVL